jgi:Fe-S-cluster-containing dehydrogenase component
MTYLFHSWQRKVKKPFAHINLLTQERKTPMNDKNLTRDDVVRNKDSTDASTPPTLMTRRQILKLGGLGGLGTLGLLLVGVHPSEITASPAEIAALREVYGPDAKGLLIHIPSRCVGCRRCELACTEYNEGKSAPAMARIKVGRNYNFGPEGLRSGFWNGAGRYGNFLIIANTCLQCSHPVPCQLACPYDAIQIVEPVNARVVTDKCVGCRTCLSACPWEMPAFDEELGVATKCHLCAGAPYCAQACPTGALQYVSWVDMTKQTPERAVVPAFISAPPDVQEACSKCH